MSDTVIIKIEHEVDLGSDEAQEIYAAVISALLNDAFMGGINPLDFYVDGDTAHIRFIDVHTKGATGYRPISDAVSDLYIFSTQDNHPEDVALAKHEAEVVAEAFEREAKRIRAHISEISGA